MSRRNSILSLACIVALPLLLGGCAGALVVGGLAGAAGGGYAAAQERGIGGAASDFEIQTEVEKALMKTGPVLQEGITTTVYQGRVLLTGHVPTPALKSTAAQLASRTPGVRALYDEVEVTAGEGAWDSAKDAWITARLRSELMLDGDIRSGNYTIDTQNGAVYLIGSARSQDELDRTTRIARYIPGVTRVVSYIELRSGAPLAARPGPGAPPPANPGPGAPAAAPRTPIEVQKL